MQRLAARDLRQLIAQPGEAKSPHVSIYVPLGATVEERRRARERLARLVGKAEGLLQKHYPQLAAALLRPMKALSERLDKISRAKGLAVFCSAKRVAYVPLEHRVGEMSVVADSFHVKPLLPLAQAHESFLVLVLDVASARLFEGTAEGLDETERFSVASARAALTITHRPYLSAGEDVGTRRTGQPYSTREVAGFYRSIDRRLKKSIGRRRTPVVLIGSRSAIGIYRSVTRLSYVASSDLDPADVSADNASLLHGMTWPIAREALFKQRRRLTRSFTMARLRGLAAEGVSDIARAAAEGRVETLFIEANVHVWGSIDSTGAVKLAKSQDEGPSDDLLDDLAERVMARGGKVHVLHRTEMPTRSVAAAVLR